MPFHARRLGTDVLRVFVPLRRPTLTARHDGGGSAQGMPGLSLKLDSPMDDTDALTPDADGGAGGSGSRAGDSFSHVPHHYQSGRVVDGGAGQHPT